MIDDDGDDIVQWVRHYPGDALIWHSDHIGPDQPYSQGWVDILCDELQNDVPMNWVWTIEAPEYADEDETAAWTFQWTPDLILWAVWDPEFADNKGPQRFEIPIDKNRFPNTSELELLNQALSEASDRAYVIGVSAWSPEQISKGLNHWAAYYAERPDIRFHWNPEGPPSPLAAEALEALEKINSGEDETVVLRRGVAEGESGLTIRASSNVMDMFMQDPDTAAEIMEALNKHLSDYNKGEDDDSDDV